MAAKQTGLGRGFDSLIPKDLIQDEFDPTAQKDRELSQTKRIKIQDIKPNPDQPRTNFDGDALKDLSSSIKEHGVLQPIIVVSDGSDNFMIIAGERRWRAAKQAGLSSIPALIRGLSEQQQLELALIENLQREDLSPLEIATSLVKLEKQFNLSAKQVGERVGKASSTVSNTKRLLRLPEPAKRALASLRINEQHARAILALEGEPQKQQELLDLILRHDWSGTKAEQFVKAHKDGATNITDAIKRTMSETKETQQIAKKLDAKVSVRHMAKGGRLVIQFKDGDDYQRIAKLLS